MSLFKIERISDEQARIAREERLQREKDKLAVMRERSRQRREFNETRIAQARESAVGRFVGGVARGLKRLGAGTGKGITAAQKHIARVDKNNRRMFGNVQDPRVGVAKPSFDINKGPFDK